MWKRKSNSTRAILSVGDMAKYEVVEIVAKLLNFLTRTKQYLNRDRLGSIGPKIVVSPLAIVNKI
jgi:hypothetical protein